MKPATENLHLVRGDTWEGMGPYRIEINEEPPAVALAEVRMQIRTKADDTTALVTLTSADTAEIEILDAAEWRFIVRPQALNLGKGRYVYDIEFEDEDGTVTTYLAGRITVDQDVTRVA